MLEYVTLGTVELRRVAGGEVRPIRLQPRQLALLAVLAVAPQGRLRRRDVLLPLFWPELDATRARGALNQAVYRLRRGLGAGVVASRGQEELELDPDRLRCDASAFEARLASEPAAALAIYGGPFLEGLHVSDAPGFERWQDGVRDRLRDRAVEAARGLADRELAGGDPERAVHWLSRLLEIAPTDERALRRLLTALAAAGDRTTAIRLYEDFTRRLAEDYGLEPSRETEALLVGLRARSARGRASDPRSDPERDRLHLRGRHAWRRRTSPGLRRAAAYFRQAIERDPGDAAAWAGLADAYTMQVYWTPGAPEGTLHRGRRAAARALALDPELAGAHASMGKVHAVAGEWRLAEREFLDALALDADRADTRHWYSDHLLCTGRMEDALREMRRAAELAPLSPDVIAGLAFRLYLSGRYEAAAEEARSAIELDPAHPASHAVLAMSRIETGEYRSALRLGRRLREAVPESPYGDAVTAYARARAGEPERSRAGLARLVARGDAAFFVGVIHAALGERDAAFHWLERSDWRHSAHIHLLRAGPLLASVRSGARYAELLGGLGLTGT